MARGEVKDTAGMIENRRSERSAVNEFSLLGEEKRADPRA